MAAALIVIGVSCTDWQWWDDIFKRQPIGENIRGWTGGDGGISIPLDKPSRALWLFGDSYVTGYDPLTNQRVWVASEDTEEGALARLGYNNIFGTTIAVQEDADKMNYAQATAPDPAETSVWARLFGTAVKIDQVEDFEWSPYATWDFDPFFNHEFFELERFDLPGSVGPAFLWPHGGYCMSCQDENATAEEKGLKRHHASGSRTTKRLSSPSARSPSVPP